MKLKRFLILILGVFAILSSCRRHESVATDASANIDVSESTIYFDTVFTKVGSTTRRFKVYNNNSSKVIISSVSLKHGPSSLFRLNVDGLPGKSFSQVEVGPKDSLFVFVEVTVNPAVGLTPFVVTDSVLFNCNGNASAVGLVAWGQDAYYIRPDTYVQGLPPYKIVAHKDQDTTWTNTKPIVIYGYAVVDSAGTLNIAKGSRIYFHPGAGLWVYRGGNLHVNGELHDSVTFQGDRLEYAYREIPGQWDRIWINEGLGDVTIDYAIIKNGFIGIQAEKLVPASDYGKSRVLKINNTLIRNMSGIGMLSKLFKIDASNMGISSCAQYCVALTAGGVYDFKHCTFADFYQYSNRQSPLLAMNNYSDQFIADFTANFGNCIVYGSLENEIGFDRAAGASFDYVFKNCLLRIDPSVNTNTSSYINIVKNPSTVFADATSTDLVLANGSAAINKGDATIAAQVPFDLKGKPRPSNSADLGAIEK